MNKKDLFFTLSISISLAILVFLMYNFYFYYNKPLYSPEFREPITNINEAWSANAQFVDIDSFVQFKIGDFLGKYIFLNSFDPSNPFSLKQHLEIKKLMESQLNNPIAVMSFDISQNQENSRVLQYLQTNKEFDWYFVLPSEENKELLKKDFGQSFSNSISKIILICPNGYLIESDPNLPAVKSTEELKSMIDSCPS